VAHTNAVRFLCTAQRIDQWFALLAAEHGLAMSSAAMNRDAERVRALRDCVHCLLSATVDGPMIPGPAAGRCTGPLITAGALCFSRSVSAPTAVPLFLEAGGRDGVAAPNTQFI
jgi:hypothetical protein